MHIDSTAFYFVEPCESWMIFLCKLPGEDYFHGPVNKVVVEQEKLRSGSVDITEAHSCTDHNKNLRGFCI